MKNVTCCVCGIVFSVSVSRYNQLVSEGYDFFCPNGHKQSFSDSTAKQLKTMTANRNWWKDQCRLGWSERDHVRRQMNGLYGYIAKLKKKIANE